MNVPPFVPQPIEIPNNVAEEPYLVCLGFVRRVVALYAASLFVVFAAAFIPARIGRWSALMLIASLLGLSLVRGLTKGRDVEQRLSVAISPALFIALGTISHSLYYQGWPIWSVAVSVGCAVLYTFACGRDLSFMGMWFLSVIGSCGTAALICWAIHTAAPQAIQAAIVNVAFLSYFVYDLAALLTRRRLGEEAGAVMDLYRDVLNMFSYPVRVIRHWRKHKIWSAPAGAKR